jgi:hypothetical protein
MTPRQRTALKWVVIILVLDVVAVVIHFTLPNIGGAAARAGAYFAKWLIS